MDTHAALLLTDLADSAALAARLGDAAASRWWAQHDRLARDLLQRWRGREIDKSDGFLLLFEDAADAVGYALDYHRALAGLEPPLQSRAGLHFGPVSLRATPAEDIARGAKPLEVDGLAKPLAARVMAAALGGQTLMTRAAQGALHGRVPPGARVVAHGHWRAKGLPAPFELFEVGDDGAPFEPPPDSAKAWQVVRQGEHWLPRRELRHSLPAERDAFVGRRAALHELAQRFGERGARLVTVLAMGGSGKTRLAQRYGWSWLGDYPGGVWFCDLAPARTLDGVLHAVAQGLALTLDLADPLQRIGHAIAGRGRCLLVLDNFEQVARHATETLGRWLDGAPQACFLVTSRELLGLPGEQTLPLPPLQAADGEALFLCRAEAAAGAGYAPQGEDRAAIAPLVRLLDGLPLAIELAAARARLMPPRMLLARMSERLELLASRGGRPDRHATLRATFDWSWELLSPADRSALAQLSVFEGGFTLEAAESVLDLAGVPDAPWTVDVLHSLLDKSLVRAVTDERFELLGSVQAYAAEHLGTPGRLPGSGAEATAAAQARHAAWFAALGPRRAVARGCADLDNLVAACGRAIAAGDAGNAAGALEGAWAALSLHGPFHAGVALARRVTMMPGLHGAAAAQAQAVLAGALEGAGERGPARRACESALALAEAAGDARRATGVNVALGQLMARDGQTAEALDRLGDALQRARALGELDTACAALNALGTVAFGRGRMDEAQAHYDDALALARALGDRRREGGLLGNIGNLHAQLGRLDEARACCEQALTILRELGDRQREANQLSNLGMLGIVQGRLDEAATACEAALAAARELGHVHLQAIVLCNLGLVREAQGRLADARRQYGQALAVARQSGDRRSAGQFLGYLGVLQAREGDFDAARTSLSEGEASLRELDDRIGLGVLLCGRAQVEALAGDAAAAQRALAQATALAEAAGAGASSELGQALARARARLAPATT